MTQHPTGDINKALKEVDKQVGGALRRLGDVNPTWAEIEKRFDALLSFNTNYPEWCGASVINVNEVKSFLRRTLLSEIEKGEGMADAAEMLWSVVANVSGGDWSKQSKEWQEAAERWRDNYFKEASAFESRKEKLQAKK